MLILLTSDKCEAVDLCFKFVLIKSDKDGERGGGREKCDIQADEGGVGGVDEFNAWTGGR